MERAELAQRRYARNSPFSYTCHACRRCCHDKIIQLNPYEVARLAANRGVSTTEFLVRYTAANGTALKQTDQGACVFLTPDGCGVHPDRPLVCRLYPLGRRMSAEGEESFREVMPHPQTEGEYGTNGTVQEFLTKQGVEPFIDAVERYVDLAGRMAYKVRMSVNSNENLQPEVKDLVATIAQRQEADVPDWLDMDAVAARYCKEKGMAVPTDATETMQLHIQAIGEWIDQL